MVPFITTVLILYFAFLFYLYFYQERLIFVGAKPNYLAYQSLEKYANALEFDDVTLQGWRIEGEKDNKSPVIIYFGGNAQDVAYKIPFLTQVHSGPIYTYNYRGYGLSEGKPNEDRLFHDASRIFQFVTKQNADKKVVVIGQSLGTAVAGYVASIHNVEKLILISPLSTLYDIVRTRYYYLVPKFIVRNKLNLIEYVRSVTAHSLVISGAMDKLIPSVLSKNTFDQIQGLKQRIEISDAGHNDILFHEETIQTIKKFLELHT